MPKISPIPQEAVEGHKIAVLGQDIKMTGYKTISKENKIAYLFKVAKRGKATIEKEYGEKQYKITFWSKLNEGDSIDGSSLCGLSTDPVNPSSMKIGTSESRTSSHSGQQWEITGDICWSQVITSWKGPSPDINPITLLKNSGVLT